MNLKDIVSGAQALIAGLSKGNGAFTLINLGVAVVEAVAHRIPALRNKVEETRDQLTDIRQTGEKLAKDELDKYIDELEAMAQELPEAQKTAALGYAKAARERLNVPDEADEDQSNPK